MKRIISRLAILLTLAVLLACASAPPADQPGSSVWKISKDGSSLFLGGSVHILRSKDFPLPREFDLAFAQSSMLVLEADIEKLADAEIAQYLMTQILLPDDTTLETVLDPPTYALLREKCAAFGLPIENLAKLKPSMAVNVLSMLQMQRFGFVQTGIDMHYLAKAKQAGMPLGFLETVEAQIDMLLSMGDGYENDFVRYSLNDMENSEKELAAIVAEWRKGESKFTEAAILEMKESWPVLYKTILSDRNAAWMPHIEEYLASGQNVFIVAGLAHMHGPDGLLRMLELSGCTIEQFRQGN
jgi:uncharacterized protein YbaP (TraB family)